MLLEINVYILEILLAAHLYFFRYEAEICRLEPLHASLQKERPFSDILSLLHQTSTMINTIRSTAMKLGLPMPDDPCLSVIPLEWDENKLAVRKFRSAEFFFVLSISNLSFSEKCRKRRAG